MEKEARQQIEDVINEVAEFAHADKKRVAICIMAVGKEGSKVGDVGAIVGGHLLGIAACIGGLMKENSHFAEAVEKAYLHHKFGNNGNTGN